MTFRVPSSDGVSVAVHHLAGSAEQPPVLISHATGFHARCYTPLAAALAGRFSVVGHDFRGHGDTDLPADHEVHWGRFGDDALAVARAVAPDGGLVAFGHSMGGAALLMAAHRDPGLFAHLVLFEPIAYPALPPTQDGGDMAEHPIIQGARRRRRRFGSFDEAYERYLDRPPLSLMAGESLRNYVDYGFRAVVGDDGEPAVELRCDPEFEAGIFLQGRDNGVWPLLPDIEVNCDLVGGVVQEMQPGSQTKAIAERLPRGRYIYLEHQTHFGPFSHPDEIAALVT